MEMKTCPKLFTLQAIYVAAGMQTIAAEKHVSVTVRPVDQDDGKIGWIHDVLPSVNLKRVTQFADNLKLRS
jgi:Cu/Ag efflux protein CusF